MFRDTNVMTREILWLRPLELRGTDAQERGAHAWVVYGYDKSTDPDRIFRMNMGWDGKGDNWYSCDSVTPNNWEFNVDQMHVVQIAPKDVVKFVGGDDWLGNGSPSGPYQNVAVDQSSLVSASPFCQAIC